MKTNYPWQINSVIHKTKTATKTLGMDAMLFSPKEEDDIRTPAAPLEMHEGYSRFKGTLIVKTQDTKVLTFNIPAKSVPYIHKKTSMLIQQHMIVQWMKTIVSSTMNKGVNTICNYFSDTSQAVLNALKSVIPNFPDIELKRASGEASTKSNETLKKSKAYTTVIRSGKLRDKIPAELLIADPKNLTLLENQKKWLEDNLKTYPTNQDQIDGINDAIALYKAGKLVPMEITEPESDDKIAKTYLVYETPCKNIKPIDSEGRYTVYQVAIKYTPENNLPFTIEVMNCFAPVDKTKGNEIVLSKAVKKQTQEIRLSEEEWYTMIDSMKAVKIMFENLTYPEQLKLAAKISKDSYDASKEK